MVLGVACFCVGCVVTHVLVVDCMIWWCGVWCFVTLSGVVYHSVFVWYLAYALCGLCGIL